MNESKCDRVRGNEKQCERARDTGSDLDREIQREIMFL